MNLLPFELETALNHPERVFYRNGEKPLEWHWFEKDPQKYPITAVHPISGSDKFTIEGSYCPNMTHRLDLFLLPPPEKRYWVNVYDYNLFQSEQEAIEDIDPLLTHIKTISFTI